MDAKQFAWLYLIEHGDPGTPSFYGGTEIDPAIIKRLPRAQNEGFFERHSALERALRQEILDHGVDWDRTPAPQSDSVSQFNGTFHDPEYKEMVVGTLILRNGLRQQWYADSIEVTNVFEMMAQVQEAVARFQTVFGAKSL